MCRLLVMVGLVSVSILGAADAAIPIAIAPAPEFSPARQPHVAIAPTGAILVTFGVGNAVYLAKSGDGGRSFTPPVKVAEQGVLALGKRRGPRVAATTTSICVAAICGSLGRGKDGDLLAWKSADGGKNWSAATPVNRVPGSAREGLFDLAAAADGRLFCVWLDLRAGQAQVYGALSSDSGVTWGENQLVYDPPIGGVCPCCQPSARFDDQGRIHVMWRNNLSDDRDMFLASSADDGRTWNAPHKLGSGTWHLRACPMDGGGLAIDRGGSVHTIWRRNQTLYRCVDGKPEESLGTGEQGRAARGPDGVYFTWITRRPGTLLVLPPNVEQPIRLAENAADPEIVARPDGRGAVVVVWEESTSPGGPIRLQVINP
jgi:hypothetical protein